jgi:DNA topoisomerase IA
MLALNVKVTPAEADTNARRTRARHYCSAALGLTHVLCTRAHPPIHPTRYTPGEASWDAGKKALYDFIVRSFLA